MLSCQLTPNSSETETPRVFAISSRIAMSGQEPPRSHLETACAVTRTDMANWLWVSPRARLASAIRCPNLLVSIISANSLHSNTSRPLQRMACRVNDFSRKEHDGCFLTAKTYPEASLQYHRICKNHYNRLLFFKISAYRRSKSAYWCYYYNTTYNACQ